MTLSKRLTLKRQQADQEKREARRRLTNCKARMCPGTFADLGRWMRNQKQTCYRVSLYIPGGYAHDRIEAAEIIHRFWTSVWNESTLDIGEAASRLKEQFGQDRSHLQ